MKRGSNRGKVSWRDVRGILLLDKPRGMSSNAALQEARAMFAAEKGGHTGSLDPLATGLLPICFGEATKIAGLLLGSRKAYETDALLGATTSTDDADGEVLAQRPVPELDPATIHDELARLTGRIRQVPPVYSALKQGGERLYRRARRGETVEAPEREVEVSRFELLGRDGARLRLLIECGSGTYVRSLVRDLGERLGCGAHVVALRRLWVEPFLTPTMHTLDQLSRAPRKGSPRSTRCCCRWSMGWRAIRKHGSTAHRRRNCARGKPLNGRVRPEPAWRWIRRAGRSRSQRWRVDACVRCARSARRRTSEQAAERRVAGRWGGLGLPARSVSPGQAKPVTMSGFFQA